MPPALAQEVLDFVFTNDKPLYRAVLAGVAEAKRVRPVFLEKKPRAERNADMLSFLARPRLEEISANLLRGWLLKAQTAMITGFLDQLGVAHKEGVVEEFPETIDDAKLKDAVEGLLAKYPKETVAVYLNTIKATSVPNWKNLEDMLSTEPRLQLA